MKFTKFIVFFLLVLFVFPINAAPKAKKTKAIKGLHAVYTDWQGAAFGAKIPEWVGAVASADTEENLRTLLNKPKDYRVWSIYARGENLDALKMLTDNFDIQTSVGASISQNVAQIAKRLQESDGATDEAKIAEQTSRVVNMITTNLTLNGLERVSSYWTKYYMADKKGKPVPGDSGKELYSYIIVMGMEGERFNKQLDAAMLKINNNTDEDEYLRKLSDAVIADLRKPEILVGSINAGLDITYGERKIEPDNNVSNNDDKGTVLSTLPSENSSALSGDWGLQKIRNDAEGCTVYTFSYVSPESHRIIVGLKLADNPMKSKAYCGISDMTGSVVLNGSDGKSIQKNYSDKSYGYDYWYLNGSDGDAYRCNTPDGRDTTRWLFDFCLNNETITLKSGNSTATFKTAGLKNAIENAGITVRTITDAFANGKI